MERFVIKVQCGGSVHEVEVTDYEVVCVLNHDVDEELAMSAFGAPPPPCMLFADDWRRHSAAVAIGKFAAMSQRELVMLAADWCEHGIKGLSVLDRDDCMATQSRRELMLRTLRESRLLASGMGDIPRGMDIKEQLIDIIFDMARNRYETPPGVHMCLSLTRAALLPENRRGAIAAYMSMIVNRGRETCECISQERVDLEYQWQIHRFRDVVRALDADEPWPALEATT